jgi:hypothetical protein
MTRICLSLACWGQVVNTSSTKTEDAYYGWPPTKLYADGHLDLEFGPLLLADSIGMDANCYHQLIMEPPKHLRTVALSLQKLEGEGHLNLVNYEANLHETHRPLKNRILEKLKQPEAYRKAVQDAMRTWEGMSRKYSRSIDRTGDLVAELPIGILHALRVGRKKLTLENAATVRDLVFKRGKLTPGESEIMAHVAQPYLEQVYTNLQLSRVLNGPMFDWEDLGLVYRRVIDDHWSEQNKIENAIPKARELFNLSLSRLEPCNVDEFIRTKSDPRIEEFRRRVIDAAEKQEQFPEHLAQDLSISQSVGENRAARLAQTITVFGAGVAFVGGLLTAGSPALGAAVAAGILASERRTEHLVRKYIHRDIGWFLCLAGAKREPSKIDATRAESNDSIE